MLRGPCMAPYAKADAKRAPRASLVRWREKRGEKRGLCKGQDDSLQGGGDRTFAPLWGEANPPLLLPRYTRKSGSPTVRSSPEPFGLL